MIAAPRGIIAAMVTPFEADGESVDMVALKRLVNWLIAGGVDGVLVLGGTGEYLALSDSERRTVLDCTMAEVGGRVPVYVGILSPGLGDSIHMAKLARDAGASGIMVVTPYYATPSQEGIFRYFATIAERISLPLILYNIPSRTGINMQVETVQRLAEEVHSIVGIKECSRDLGHVFGLIRALGDRISVLSGEDDLALPEFLLGAQGAILASANLVPNAWQAIIRSVQAGDAETAKHGFANLQPLFQALFSETNPAPLKEALSLANLGVGPCRYPLTPIRVETRISLQRELDRLGIATRS